MVKTIDGRESWAVFEMRRRRWKLALQSDWNGAAPPPCARDAAWHEHDGGLHLTPQAQAR